MAQVKSYTTPEFWERYHALPDSVQKLADRSFKIWLADPRHPSLQFKKIGSSSLYSVRVGAHYRAVGYFYGDTVEWGWIGSHEEYNKLRKK